MLSNNPVVVLYMVGLFGLGIWLAYILFEDLRRKGQLNDWKAIAGHTIGWVFFMAVIAGSIPKVFGFKTFGFAKATSKFATDGGEDIMGTPLGQMKFPSVGYSSSPAEDVPDFGESSDSSDQGPPSFSSGSPGVPEPAFEAPAQPAPTATPKPKWQIIGEAPLVLFAADYKRAGHDLIGDSAQADRSQFPVGMICRANKQYTAPNAIVPDGFEDWQLLCWLDTNSPPYSGQTVTIKVNGNVVQGLGVHKNGREFRGTGDRANWPQMFQLEGTVTSLPAVGAGAGSGAPLCPDQRPAVQVTLPGGSWTWDCSGT